MPSPPLLAFLGPHTRAAVCPSCCSFVRQGALFNDGVSGLFSALGTSLPLTTFAQNNGIISLTNVAARQAGWACGCWLFLLGILGKVRARWCVKGAGRGSVAALRQGPVTCLRC